MSKSEKSQEERVTSPAASGGDGNFFEQHVNAHWLTLLLVQAIPPILTDCVIKEVYFQVEHLHWNTDDFLLIGETGSGFRRKLLGQVKKTFVVSSSNEDCQKTIKDFWGDFKNGKEFSSDTDRFSIVTLRGPNVLLEYFVGLLDCARAARDAEDFAHRLNTPGFVHKSVGKYYDQIQNILKESEGCDVPTSDIWPFLKVIHLISMDLNTSTAQTEAQSKTLLAHSTSESDPIGAANATWNALLAEVGRGMASARSYTRSSLPKEVLKRHSPPSGSDHGYLAALKTHSKIILNGISTDLGTDTHLPRAHFVQATLSELSSSQVVVLSGKAGTGKSAIAKMVLKVLEEDTFTFCFRADEFARSHIDEVFVHAQVPCSAARVSSLLAGQGRKVMLVESVERLLEKSTRDAFSDLIGMVAQDASWRLILTCREYSVDLFCEALMDGLGVRRTITTIGALSDQELDYVSSRHPSIQAPLVKRPLRELFRNPYILGMALRLPWAEHEGLPANEIEFRKLCWRKLVRADAIKASGMPRRREAVFTEIALRRARDLSTYVSCGSSDQEALESLANDSLLTFSVDSNTLAAPAHDVLEDWAILEWIDSLHSMHDQSIEDFSRNLGKQPAIRRAYRKWVSEYILRNVSGADELFLASLQFPQGSHCFVDDTIVAILRSAEAPNFLRRHVELLLVNERNYLIRIIHLLRVGCVKNPDWMALRLNVPLFFPIPDGPAWDTVLDLVKENLSRFELGGEMLLLGLIEDWARGVSVQTPYPAGANSVAAIAHWLLPRFGGYQFEEQQISTLKVIAKIPKSDSDRFLALLRGNEEASRRDFISDKLKKLVFSELEGLPAARDLAEHIVPIGWKYFLHLSDPVGEDRAYHGEMGVEKAFGIDEIRHFEFFPASAIRGPFLHLLRYHPTLGCQFIVDLCNFSSEWYGRAITPQQFVELPSKITLELPDGELLEQWCNERLWNAYRGSSVAPEVLTSALMALEKWLLELGETAEDELSIYLNLLLTTGTSALTTSVVASVATAYPRASVDVLLTLLSAPECIFWDLQRMAGEVFPSSAIHGMLPQFDPIKKIYESEREESDALPHRKTGLETAITNLQTPPYLAKVRDVLDDQRTKLPPIEEQTEFQKLWRLALYRMDLRYYRRADEHEVSKARRSDPSMTESAILLMLDCPDDDLKDMTKESESISQEMLAFASMKSWAVKKLKSHGLSDSGPELWKKHLERAMEGSSRGIERDSLGWGSDAIEFVAAVCVRDYWDELGTSERIWCVDTVCSELKRKDGDWNQIARMQQNGLSADRICSNVLPILITKRHDEVVKRKVDHALVTALSHSINEVRQLAIQGLATLLPNDDIELITRYAVMVSVQAKRLQDSYDMEQSIPYRERRDVSDIEREIALDIRDRRDEIQGIDLSVVEDLNPCSIFGARGISSALTILQRLPEHPTTIKLFRSLATNVVLRWNQKRIRQKSNAELPYELQLQLVRLLEGYMFTASDRIVGEVLEILLQAMDDHPDELAKILEELIGFEDRLRQTSRFWMIWDGFAEKVQSANWLGHLDDSHCNGCSMVRKLFLETHWKDGVKHWSSVEGYDARIHSLFAVLPQSPNVLEAYVYFHYRIGDNSLPDSFVRISEYFRRGDPAQLLQSENVIFMLEVLLRRYVYGRPAMLKRSTKLRDSVLELLDALVERGSSAAYRMRDDFVTPLVAE